MSQNGLVASAEVKGGVRLYGGLLFNAVLAVAVLSFVGSRFIKWLWKDKDNNDEENPGF